MALTNDAGRGADGVDDLLVGGTRAEHRCDPHLLEPGNVDVGDDAADDHGRLQPHVAQGADDGRREGEMRPVVHRHAHHVDVLLHDGCGDRLWRLAEPGKDHLEPVVPQYPGDDTQSPVVTVEADLGKQHAYRRVAPTTRRTRIAGSERGLGAPSAVHVGHTNERSNQMPNTDSSACIASPTVT